MDLYRFYLPDLEARPLVLPEDQARHAVRVLRLATGTTAIVFDGRGGWAEGRLNLGRRDVEVELTAGVQHDDAPRSPLTLITAVPKGDRADWLIEQASQLGVAVIQWLDAQRSVVRPKESGGKIEKWRRLAIESAKQCGRNYVMQIAPMRPLDELLKTFPANGKSLCLDPRSSAGVSRALSKTDGPISALIGPEGGWSPREMEQLNSTAGLISVRLTPTVLRIETACAAIAAIIGAQG